MRDIIISKIYFLLGIFASHPWPNCGSPLLGPLSLVFILWQIIRQFKAEGFMSQHIGDFSGVDGVVYGKEWIGKCSRS